MKRLSPCADPRVLRASEVLRLAIVLARAQIATDKATDRRAALPAGTSRARVTTANARWGRAAEARDRAEQAYSASLARLVEVST